MSTNVPESPRPPGWHYRAAAKLLKQAEDIGTQYADLPYDVALLNKAHHLATTHDMLASRAAVHAELANARRATYDEAESAWALAYKEATR